MYRATSEGTFTPTTPAPTGLAAQLDPYQPPSHKYKLPQHSPAAHYQQTQHAPHQTHCCALPAWHPISLRAACRRRTERAAPTQQNPRVLKIQCVCMQQMHAVPHVQAAETAATAQQLQRQTNHINKAVLMLRLKAHSTQHRRSTAIAEIALSGRARTEGSRS